MHAQHVKSPKGDYWIGRYTDGNGKPGAAVIDERGKPVRFPTKKKAKNAADGKEAEVREGRWKDPNAAPEDPDAGVLTFDEWANRWYASLNLAPSTMENYRQHLELHILRYLQEKKMTLTGFLSVDVDAWEKKLRAQGRPDNSIRSYRATLSTCLAAAVPALLPANPAHRKPNTGKRTGKKGGQRAAENSEKVITTIFGELLIAEGWRS